VLQCLLLLIVSDVGSHGVGVERARGRHRIVQFGRWKPRTYLQVWLFAALGLGLPGFIIWSLIGSSPPTYALSYAGFATFFGGLTLSSAVTASRSATPGN
jgi:hypothetical protein